MITFSFRMSSGVPCKRLFGSIAVLAISTFIQFVSGLRSDARLIVFMINPFCVTHALVTTFIQIVSGLISDVMLKVFMINPFLIRHTLVKRDTIVPLSTQKLIFMS